LGVNSPRVKKRTPAEAAVKCQRSPGSLARFLRTNPAGGVMKKISRSAMFTVFLGLGIAAFAQAPSKKAPPSQQQGQDEQNQQAGGEQTTLTGCLMKDATSNQYAITDSKSGESFSFAAPDQLQKYVNQTVQLTGTVMNRGGQKAFRPESVKAVSASCQAASK
jgi:hypothetical protein